jgi:hypothetical protein
VLINVSGAGQAGSHSSILKSATRVLFIFGTEPFWS